MMCFMTLDWSKSPKKNLLMRPINRPPTSPSLMLRLFMKASTISLAQLEKYLGWPPAQLENLLQVEIELTAAMALDRGNTGVMTQSFG